MTVKPADLHRHKGKVGRSKKAENLSNYGKWYRRLHYLTVLLFGGKCSWCGVSWEKENLEFCHIHKKQTPLSDKGSGRGSYNRIKDVLENPEAYRLGCNACHAVYDNRSVKGDL